MNSEESVVSCCHSIMLLSQVRRSTCRSVRPCLYIQWAAMPYSAVVSISWVRIWISKSLPSLLMTVVCSDWYMLNLGIAM
jgi:hypothetical protein